MWLESGKANFFSLPEHNCPEHDIVAEFV
jgi:hypothetical protein